MNKYINLVTRGSLLLCLLYYVFLYVYSEFDEASSTYKSKYNTFKRGISINLSYLSAENRSIEDPIRNGSFGVLTEFNNSVTDMIAAHDKSLDYKSNKDYYEGFKSDPLMSEANVKNDVEPIRNPDNHQTSQVGKKIMENVIILLEGFESSKLSKFSQKLQFQKIMSVFEPDTPMAAHLELALKRRRLDLENFDETMDEEDAEVDRQYNQLLNKEREENFKISSKNRSILNFNYSDQARYRKAGRSNHSYRNKNMTSFIKLPKPAMKLENHDSNMDQFKAKRNLTMAKNLPASITNFYGTAPMFKSHENPSLRRNIKKTETSHEMLNRLITITNSQVFSRNTTLSPNTQSSNAPILESATKSTPDSLLYPTIMENTFTKTTMFNADIRHHKSMNDKFFNNNSIAPLSASPRPRILFWNPTYSMWRAEQSMKLCQPAASNQLNGLSTALPMCEMTSDRSLFQTSDVVVFHPLQLSEFDLPNNTLLNNTIRMKQKWVFVSRETPSNLKEHAIRKPLSKAFPYPTITAWESKFDWLITYNAKPVSDFFYPYRTRYKLPHDPNRQIGWDIEKLRNRKLIVAVVSNCYSNKRLELIHKLKKLLPEMELFGKCFNREVCLESTVHTPTSKAKTLKTHQPSDYPQKYYSSKDTSHRYQYNKALEYTAQKLDHGTLNSTNARHTISQDVRTKTVKLNLSKNHSCLMDVISQFKFVIAIENSANCPDYITEKYWEWPLKTGAIPIVGGSDRETYKRFAIPGSYLHIDDYKSVEEMANHIRHIDGNIQAHAQLLEWHKTWGVKDSISDTWCELCQQAQKETHQRGIKNNAPGQADKERHPLVQSKTDNKKKFDRWWNGCNSYYR